MPVTYGIDSCCSLHLRRPMYSMGFASQTGCDALLVSKLMRTLSLAVAAAVAFGLAAPLFTSGAAQAAPSSSLQAMRAKMTEMKAKDPQGYAACVQLARTRGYQLHDQ